MNKAQTLLRHCGALQLFLRNFSDIPVIPSCTSSLAGLFFFFLMLANPSFLKAQNPLEGIQGFQVLTEGDFTVNGGPHIHGPLGVGGNFVLNTSNIAEINMDNVGTYIFPGDGTKTTGMLVKGGITWTNGMARILNSKLIHVGSSTGSTQSDNGTNQSTQVLPTSTAYNNAKRIETTIDQTPTPAVFQTGGLDISSLFTTYRAVSEGMGICTNNVQLYNSNNVAIAGNNVTTSMSVQINSLATGVNYLDLTQSSLSKITEFKFNNGAAPSATKLLVITVPLTSNFTWNNPNMPGASGSSNGAYTLWNFSGTTTYNLTISSSSLVIGTIFAPNHNFYKTGSGDIDGNLIAKTITIGTGEIHYFQFTGNVPVCSSCSNYTSAGTIGSNQTGSDSGNFDPTTLTETVAPSGGSGTAEYQWQTSTDNATWADISGATAQTYDPPAISATTYYRRAIRRSGCTSYIYSASVTMTTVADVSITAQPVGGTVASGDPYTLSVGAACGISNITYQWKKSTDNITFTNISGATSSTYTTPPLTASAAYRVDVGASGNGFSTVTSNPAQVGVGSSSSLSCGNFLGNPEFDYGTNRWSLSTSSGNTATWSVNTGSQLSGTNSALINISTATGGSANAKKIQFYQSGYVVYSGTTYTVSFQAKAASNRNISVSLQQVASPYATYATQTVALTTTKNTYTLTFPVTTTDLNGAGLYFNLGESTANVYLDDVVFSEQCGSQLCANGTGHNIISNSEMDNGLSNWGLSVQGGASATSSIVSTSQLSGTNSAFINIGTATGTNWHVQFYQAGHTVQAGTTYRVTFKAKATASRNMYVSLQQNYSPWSEIDGKTVSLTTTTKTFTLDFLANQTDENDIGLYFHMGESNADVYIDDIEWAELCNTEICNNGYDDDGDGNIDGADTDCSTCDAPTYGFQNGTLISGTALSPGAVYLFQNVTPGTDVRVKINSFSHSDIKISNIDLSAYDAPGGYNLAFQPQVLYGWKNSNGTYDSPGERFVNFTFSFYDAGTNNPQEFNKMVLSAIDVDGDNSSLVEFIETSGFASYETNSPTALTLSGALKAKSNISNATNIDETALDHMISYTFNNKTSINVKYGADWTGASNSFADDRLNSLFFKCYALNTQVACPTVSVTGQYSVCTGVSQTLTSSTSGGSGTKTYQWQSSLDNETWTNISGATSASYTTPALTAKTYYRLSVTFTGNPTCGAIYSDDFPITPGYCLENCTNGIDDNGNGLVDGADLDCVTLCPVGSVTYQRWLNIGGASITDLTGNANYPNTPSETGSLTSLDGPDNIADNYGTRVRGYITPSTTGNYVFNLTSDDAGQFFLSSNADPVNKSMVASVTGWTNTTEYIKYSSQTSSPYYLQAGRNYYFEILQKEGGGSDHFQVYWKTPSNANWTIVPGGNLRPYNCDEICGNTLDDDGNGLADCAETVCQPTITTQPTGSTICTGGTYSLGVVVSGTASYQWQSSTNNSTFTNISGATSSSYTTPVLTATTYYRVIVTKSGCSVNSVSATVTVVADPTITAQPANATICTGGTQTLSVTATGGTPSLTYQWQSSTDNVTFTNISGATSSSYTTPALATTMYYKVIVSASGNGCGAATSSVAIVTVVAAPTITSQPASATICSGGTQSLSVTATGGTPSLTYQWQSSTDNATFSNISGATSNSYTTAALTATTYFRVLVSASGTGCGSTTSTTATVTVVPVPTITSQPVSATICSGGTQILSVAATGGTPSLTYQWQSSTNNSTFTNISGATSSSYTTPALTTTTYYRVLVSASGNGCATATSNAATVTVVAAPTISTQPAGATICTSGTQTLSVTATGGTPSLTYQWQSSTDNVTFTNISGATSSSYTTPALTTTTYYKVIVSASGSGCGAATSSVATVTVVAAPTITAQPAGATICSGGTQTLSVAASGGTPSLTYQWQSSTDNVTFTNISGATSNSYTTAALTATTYYRVVVGSSGAGCVAAVSNAATVTVVADPTITSQPSSTTICAGGTPTLSVTGTGGTPSLSYQWQSSTDNITFSNISGATSSSYTTPILGTTTYYKVVLSASGNGCGTVTSAVATVTVVPAPTISTQPASATICTGGTQTLSVTATGGTPSLTYQWQSSSNNSTFTNISGATSSSYTTPALTATTYYRVIVSASGNGCGAATSAVATVMVVATPTITSQPASATVCSGGTQSLSVTASGGISPLTYQWQSSTDNSTFTNISGATSSSYTTPVLTTTIYYKVLVSSSGTGCGSVTSNTAAINVVADPSITAQPVSATICAGGTQAFSVTATGGTPVLTYQWQNSTDNSTFTDISGATSSSFTTPALTATTYYRVIVGAAGNGCGAVTSTVATATVVPVPAITSQPSSATICAGGTQALSVTATGGTPSLTYQWQSSTDNVTFTNISGATSSSYTTPGLTVTTYYRVLIFAAGTGCGNITSNIATINVVPIPTISAQPAGATICAGGTQTLSVSATGGTPTLNYQWQSSTDNVTFTNISGATSSSYTTPALSSTTYYKVMVSAAGIGCGSVTSTVATVAVVATPTITTQPASATVCAGATQALSVTATGGTPSLTYQWQSSTDNVTFTNISGATSSSYTTPAILANTYFRVLVSATGSGCSTATSAVATITMVSAPTITAQPASTSICSNSTQTLSVTATGGTPSLTYQWQSSTDNVTFTNISGATSSSYTTPVLTATRYYKVIISATGNGCGAATSSVATVTVVPVPTITSQPASAAICSGGTQSLSVTATGGTPSLTYQWQSSTDNATFTNISGATSSSYTTAALTATTYYKVIVSATGTGCTSITSTTATVTVASVPTITSQPVSATICSGGTQALSVAATGGTPSLTYQWQSSTNNSTFTNISGATSSSYTTPALTTTTYFRVLVSASGNGCATATSNAATVTVVADPTITTQPASTTICSGLTTTLSVVATGGTPNLNYQWQTSLTGTSLWTNISGATSSTYTTPILALTSYYRVIVSASGSDCGSVTSSVATVTLGTSLTPVITGNTTICNGSSTILAVVGIGNYAWSTGSTSATISVAPTTTTTYTVTLTNATGCTGTAQAIVTVNPLPTANAGTDATVCAGTSTLLTATGGISYAWSNGLGSGASKSVTPATTTTYTVTVMNANGCTATDQVVVNVNATPAASAGSNITICKDASTTLAASASGGVTPYAFSWSNSLGSNSTINVSPTTTSTYTVTVTGSNGCSSTAPVTVTVNAVPTANAGADVTICSIGTTTLTATGAGAPIPYSFNWSNGSSLPIQVVTPGVTTTYTVTVTSSNGCFSTDQVVVVAQPCVENCSNILDDDGDGLADCADSDCGPVANAGTDMSICPGTPAFLNVGVTGGTMPYTYVWSNGLGTGPTKTVNPAITTTYSVTVTSATGCTSVDQVKVTVLTCAENCTNGIDDDNDGLVDCADPNCAGVTAPILVDDNYTTCPGIPYSNRVTYNDGNLNNPLITIVSEPTHGTVTIDWTGKFVYTPNSFECLTDHFTYQICNQSSGCCGTAVANITMGDNTQPTLINVPADLTISCDDAVPDAPMVTGYDQCPGIYLDYVENSTQNFASACGSYTITRTWTATDFCGNTISDDQIINVVDQTKPELFQLYTLEGGAKMVAGFAQRVTHDWKYVRFPITFKAVPVVLASIATNDDPTAVVTQVRNVSMQGFELRLREEEVADGKHGIENVSWIAVDADNHSGNMVWEAGTLANVNETPSPLAFKQAYSLPPLFFSSSMTNIQNDPASLRHTNLSGAGVEVFAQEEQSLDAEVTRASETVGYLAMKSDAPLLDKEGEEFGEAGRLNVTNAWATVNFNRKYTKPVVIVGGLTNNDDQAVTFRVRNLTATKFEVRLQEWNYLDGNHASESISWMVVEGSVPGNQSFYCQGKAGGLKPNINLFAVDNCDDLVNFAYDETAAQEIFGLTQSHTWTVNDDCGNTTLISRNDTCQVVALKLKALIYGSLQGNTGNNLTVMRDNLREQALLPILEPYTAMPAFPYVKYPIHITGGTGGTGGGIITPLVPMVDICHKGTDGQWSTKSVPLTEIPYYIAIGDNIGACGTTDPTKITICHKPGTNAQKTLIVSVDALLAHLAHGDLIGSCAGSGNEQSTGAATAQYQTIADGLWTDAATWLNGVAPPAGGTISNKTISITHKVTLKNAGLKLKSGSKLYVTGGSLKLDDDIEVQDASVCFDRSVLDMSDDNTLKITNNAGVVKFTDSSVKIGKDLLNSGGKLKMDHVQLALEGKYENNLGTDSLINVCANIKGDVLNKLLSKLYISNSSLKLEEGDFTNLGTVTGGGIKLLIEDGGLLNIGGLWNAPLLQYCISGTLGLPTSILPNIEDCNNISNTFSPCNCYDDVNNMSIVGSGNAGVVSNIIETINAGKSYGDGELDDPSLLNVTGSQAIVDWVLVEIRSMDNDADVLGYQSVILERDGDIISEKGDSVLVFPGLEEGDYYVTIRHRNHLGLTTNTPIFLSIIDPPTIDFSDPNTPVKGGANAGKLIGGKRSLWGGDLNGDGKVIYQGPNNDVFRLFSKVISNPDNATNLANYIVPGYETTDFNMDGKSIYQGPNNDRSHLLLYSILSHPGNFALLANYIALDFIP